VRTRVDVGITPTGVAYGGNPGEEKVWVSVREDRLVVAVDPRTGQVVHRTLVGNRPRGVTVVNDRSGRPTVWVAVGGVGGVAVVEPFLGGVEQFVFTGGYPLNVASDTQRGAVSGDPVVWVTEVDDGWVARLTWG
jgi:streptogramin lyase